MEVWRLDEVSAPVTSTVTLDGTSHTIPSDVTPGSRDVVS